MRLVEFHVRTFKNILDSTPVSVDEQVTCVVGKNESGKTALLHALYRLNPAYVKDKFNQQQHYPAWLAKKHEKEGTKLSEARPIEATFELTDSEMAALDDRFGKGALKERTYKLAREYSGKRWFDFATEESKAVQVLRAAAKIPGEFAAAAKAANTIKALDAVVESLSADGGENTKAAAEAIIQAKKKMLGDVEFRTAIMNALDAITPSFFYFDEYSALPGIIPIREILEKEKKDLDDDERAARALLEMAGADDEYLLNADYEVRKRELENVANSITHEVLEYWSTNPELRVLIDISQKTVAIPQGKQSVLDELRIRLWDDRHLLSLPFDERSTGFRWFFSFLAAFSEFEHDARPVIILLDEPGLGLHARAQRDFLRFIEERLSKRSQVIYSTHSPFLVQPNRLERARLVQDEGRERGSRTTSDVLSTDRDTLFPLQGALGYDLAQHLFVGPHNLVVEGTSDYTYLIALSDYLREAKREGLNEKWSIVPVGGADLVPSFVALLGNHLDVTVVLDSRKEGNQRLARLVQQEILAQSRILLVGDVLGKKTGDIEDLFEEQEYLDLYNTAFNGKLKATDLKGDDPIVARIARYLNVERFDHGRPADIFLRTRDKVLPKLSAQTLARFEELFKRVNKTMGTGPKPR